MPVGVGYDQGLEEVIRAHGYKTVLVPRHARVEPHDENTTIRIPRNEVRDTEVALSR